MYLIILHGFVNRVSEWVLVSFLTIVLFLILIFKKNHFKKINK